MCFAALLHSCLSNFPSLFYAIGLVTIRFTFHVSQGVNFNVHYTQLIMSFYESQMFIIYENNNLEF